jgi:hypothetical protein
MQALCNGPGIIKLLDVVLDKDTKTPALVCEHVKNVDFKVRCAQSSGAPASRPCVTCASLGRNYIQRCLNGTFAATFSTSVR